jgi:CheY-like chemotaxis protein
VPRRVLVIDDEADIREVTSLSLETMAGWEVLQSGSSADGIEKASREQPDVILLDLMMPDVDGKTTLSRLRQNEKTSKIPVLLLTAKVQAFDLDELIELGLTGVLSKPFDPLTLSDDIAAKLGWADER